MVVDEHTHHSDDAMIRGGGGGGDEDEEEERERSPRRRHPRSTGYDAMIDDVTSRRGLRGVVDEEVTGSSLHQPPPLPPVPPPPPPPTINTPPCPPAVAAAEDDGGTISSGIVVVVVVVGGVVVSRILPPGDAPTGACDGGMMMRRRRSLRLREMGPTYPLDDTAGGGSADDDGGNFPRDDGGEGTTTATITTITTTTTTTTTSDALDYDGGGVVGPPMKDPPSHSSSSPDDKENSSNGCRRTKKRKIRRDTFDLSRGRGRHAFVGARRGPAGTGGLSVLVRDDGMDVSTSSNDGDDYVTPKAGNAVVNVSAMVERISRTFDDVDVEDGRDRRHRGDDDHDEEDAMIANDNGECVTMDDDETMEIITRCNPNNLTSAAIDIRMRDLFPERMRQIHRYPCVSARIFAAMSSVYSDRANFAPLLPLLVALVDAEIVSLTNKDDRSEVLFINKRVCFSGFDCSSTTTAVGTVVGQGGGNLGPSVEALEAVLRAALELSRPVHYLDLAIRCLRFMSSCQYVSDACAGTIVGYYPSARFRGALVHYANELMDVKCFLTSQRDTRHVSMHVGVRYRLNDFIGRTIRYHLRESLNTIPASAIDFNVDKCIERWGRAVDDRSISSILTFALERVHELATTQSEIFDRGNHMPIFFAGEASKRFHSFSRDDLKRMDKFTFESLVTDVVEARSFLSSARAFREHVDASGGWVPVEAMASTFYKLNLHEGSDIGHLVQLRDVQDLLRMVKDFVLKAEGTVARCELCIRGLQMKLNFKTKSAFIRDLKVHLSEEKREYFPLVVAP
ncbi:hypothetical protein ACHAXA_006667 [Cyclostephanos tholiformis]|uniref:Uncharacterized protein n=1 Tax=Cyclostephanos tholiformis TaxID=382380 RepID=A0ABD3R331_9STRA